MARQRIRVSGTGWVLPSGSGSGTDVFSLPDVQAWKPEDNAALAGFSAKPYLNSVKGYLDPAGACFLAAASLATDGQLPQGENGPNTAAGMCSMTRYGAPGTGLKFYDMLVKKGPRFASPLLFPHSYSNTAGNLAAIEFELGGPHMVFYGSSDAREAFHFAAQRLEEGTASDMLVGAYEATTDTALPDGLVAMNGGVVVWLSNRTDAPELTTMEMDLDETPADWARSPKGSVFAMLSLLQTFGG
ncbi:MAG: hypothetical protein HN742_09095 [Lentisphaerae bacterium]|jgi:hypothetical protein|nr:hypothetical protein [Lentisphaerota bacterium]MBT4816601.1 hypothetical protein [Lentisphaerota bacterium]MBT5610951.1 hypothetical protein [Lentisphaerota bacterium]MBT7053637.1 hypothetical protein [Lentisphaerota bacterium]MBT7842016.1 hypothetical protein [Lentisphaerota bacterium]